MENPILPTACWMCSLMLPEGTTHQGPHDCIKELRRVLIRQKEISQSLAFEISVRYLAVLERLAKNPGTDVAYVVDVPGLNLPCRIPPEKVAGIFAAILFEYQKVGNWSPLTEAKDLAQSRLTDMQLLWEMLFVVEVSVSPESRGAVKALLEDIRPRLGADFKPLGVPSHDPSGS